MSGWGRNKTTAQEVGRIAPAQWWVGNKGWKQGRTITIVNTCPAKSRPVTIANTSPTEPAVTRRSDLGLPYLCIRYSRLIGYVYWTSRASGIP